MLGTLGHNGLHCSIHQRSPGKGLLYEDKGHTQVVGCFDANWANSPIDRRSTFGFFIFRRDNICLLEK